MNNIEQLRQWAEEEKEKIRKDKIDPHLTSWFLGYREALSDMLEKITELQPVKPDSVEGYLDKSFAYTVHLDKDGKSCRENEAYESIEAVTYDNALAALQQLSMDKDAQYGLRLDTIAKLGDIITNLTAEVERLKRWISVEDRLPECDEMVITYPYSMVTIRHMKMDEDNKAWFFDAIPVTHWKPLPEPPK